MHLQRAHVCWWTRGDMRELRVVQAHVTIGAGLSDATKLMQDVVSALRVACVDIGGESVKVHKAIDSSRRGLHSTFVDHQAACR